MTELTTYAIRISPRAARDIVAASAGMAALAGPSAAAEWEQGLFGGDSHPGNAAKTPAARA